MEPIIISVFVSFLVYLVIRQLNKPTESENPENIKENKKIKIGLLTNELPPIVYGGVSTWVINFMKMFKDNEFFEVIPIFLSHIDKPHESFFEKYPNIRVLNKDNIENDIRENLKDIKVVVNNVWVANDMVKKINTVYPNIKIISVVHSLIKMEHITNMGSVYTNNFYEQENVFKYSDYVVLISKAEEEYYKKFGYDKYKAKTFVIYNSYCPKYDNTETNVDYNNNTLGYIGRHVPRKRPEIPIKAMSRNNQKTKVVNMGMHDDDTYWNKLEEEHDNLETIKFSTDKTMVNKYWNKVGCNCITGVYEPFGYTMCETLDRMVPAIVQNIDGPKEIVDEFKDCIYMYTVDKDFNKDVDNFYEAYTKFINTSPEIRKENAIKARKALDKFRPENISKQWMLLFKELYD